MAEPLDKQAVSSLKGVGPALADKLRKLGIDSVQDLLFHLPLRYQDRTRVTPIAALRIGQEAVIEGVVRGSDIVLGRRRSLVCRLQDGTGTITLRFFHFSKAQQANLKTGDTLRCFGQARRGASGLEIVHPEYRHISQAGHSTEDRLTPVYPTTDGFSQHSWRKLTDQALLRLSQSPLAECLPPEALPAALRIPLAEALQFLHRPPPGIDTAQLAAGLHPFQQRLAFEELIAHQLSLLALRDGIRTIPAPALAGKRSRLQQCEAGLPFTLTGAQQRALQAVLADIAKPVPMLRLVQGDVGSGKTVVAALAALAAIDSGAQVAVMAPTEILAEQHLKAFEQWLAPLQIKPAGLAGKTTAAERRPLLGGLADGSVKLVIGTHALFQAEVQYKNLGLVIIDEQHRFGVHQRLALSEKAPGHTMPHQLIMTATPIPRTLAMSAYADLDTTVIDELPPGRQPVTTVVIDNQRRDEVIARIHRACREGRQAYWVCTLIEESEELDCEAAEETARLLAEALPDIRIGLLHGRMKPTEKARGMQAFKNGETQLLVATTVIEVGVDVPNASLMVIENPERLGLAQLHQLRGRVGRGREASHCVLLYGTPLSEHAKARLQVMRETGDGFVIAEKDLELRGPGELLGARQAGLVQYRIADLARDAHWLDAVREAALHLRQEQAAVIPALIRRWLPEAERVANA